MSAPVTAAVIIGSVVIGGAVVELTSQLEARHRVQAAAQNAALAAADSYFGWIEAEPCSLARSIAEQGKTVLESCEIRQFDVVISLRVHTVLGDSIGVARAGIDGTHLSW